MLGPPWLEMERKVTEEQWKKRFFSSLWLKSGKESCPAQQCYCSATPGEGGGMLGAGATQSRVSMLQGMAGTGNIIHHRTTSVFLLC